MDSGDEMEIDALETETPGAPEVPTAATAEATAKLPAGFGFTKETAHVRLSTERDLCSEQVHTKSQENTMSFIHGHYNQGRGCASPKHALDNSPTGNLSKCPVVKYQKETVEIDTILTRQLQEKVLQAPPMAVPVDYVDMSPKNLPTDAKMTCLCLIPIGKRTPDAQSDIYISHTGADKPMGDEFGARLTTFKDNRKDGSPYYRHFLERIVPNGPADQMRIDDRDELVLVNEKFAPQFTHEAVCDMFRRVKVDGKTRFTLVIRRIQENRKRKWEWIETSAILAPDKTIEEHPTIENLKFKELESDEIEFPISQHLYKVPQTQQYLDVCDGSVKLGVMKGNKSDGSKVIWKKAKYWQDNNDDIHINFAAALVDYTRKWYIAIDGGKIVLKKEPYWFKMITIGGKIRFQADDVYLGYDTTRCEVKPEVSQCTFEELPANDVDNEINADEHFEILPENADTISEEMSRHSSMSSVSSGSSRSNKSFASSISSSKSVRSSASSQSSVDSDRSSILSSQSSTDSGGLTHEFNRSSSDVSGHCSEPSSLSHSFSSESSGYRSGYKSDQHVNTEDIDIVKPTDISVERKTETTGECILTDSSKDVVIDNPVAPEGV